MSEEGDRGDQDFVRNSIASTMPEFGRVVDIKNIETHTVFAASKGPEGRYESVPLISYSVKDQVDATAFEVTLSLVDVSFLTTVLASTLVEIQEAVSEGVGGRIQGGAKTAGVLDRLSSTFKEIAPQLSEFANSLRAQTTASDAKS